MSRALKLWSLSSSFNCFNLIERGLTVPPLEQTIRQLNDFFHIEGVIEALEFEFELEPFFLLCVSIKVTLPRCC